MGMGSKALGMVMGSKTTHMGLGITHMGRAFYHWKAPSTTVPVPNAIRLPADADGAFSFNNYEEVLNNGQSVQTLLCCCLWVVRSMPVKDTEFLLKITT
jgi:hypothetical protein